MAGPRGVRHQQSRTQHLGRGLAERAPGCWVHCVVVGECAGGEGASATEFTNEWDWDVAAQFYPTWEARNYLSGSLMEVDEIVRVVDIVLRCGASAQMPLVAVTPRPTTDSPEYDLSEAVTKGGDHG
jgi:hypothetical protein